MKKTLFIMSGVMASGKSHYATKHSPLYNCKSKIVSRDLIRFSLLKDDEDYFAHEKQAYNRFVQEVQNYLDDDETPSIYADATFLTDKARRKFLNRLNLADDVEVKLIIMDTSLYTCLERNGSRKGRNHVPESAIIEAWEKFERVTNIERINETVVVWGEK